MPKITNIFFTGPSRSGKTSTLFRALRHSAVPYGGYVAKRVYRACKRESFVMVDLITGSRAPMASIENGKPVPHMEAFDGLGRLAIMRAMVHAGLIVMDELGRFELKSPAFMLTVETALSSATPVVGVVKDEENTFLDGIRARQDTRIIRLGTHNREEALHEFLLYLRPLGILRDAGSAKLVW